MLRGERVLVASQMDKAVEVVADKVEKIVGTFALARSGGRAAQRELSDKINRLTGPRRSRFKLHNLSIDELSKIAEEHKELGERLETLEARYRETIEQEQLWAESRESYDRLAPICPLPIHEIVSKNLQAAQAAANRARELLTGESGWIGRLWGRWKKSRALGLLRVPRTWSSTLDELDEALHVQELADCIRSVEQNLRTPFPADALWQEIVNLQADLRTKALRLLEATRGSELHALVRDETSRGHLRTFRAMLRRRNPKLKKQLLETLDPAVALKAFPVWGCTSRTLGQILPVTPGLFDLVVIDEASQCDLATAAAALVRGKRAVIVGDPHQLRHVCFLSKVREQAAFARHGVSSEGRERFRYRRSLFDVAADVVGQDDFFLLDQHFRSHPHIIEFSNREFYDRQLRIMTERPRPEAASAIRVVNVDGRRNADSSVNPIEVEAVLSEVEKLVVETAGHKQPPSIGIVCPFRDHVDALRNAIVKTLSGKVIERHGVVVGTAHSLQGDEKDIVLLSTSIDRESHPASLRFLENPNVFNVAITRARRSLVVVTSVPQDDLPSGLLSDYLLHAKQTLEPHQPGEEYDNDFEERLARELAKQNVSLWPNFESAGVRIDLVAGETDRHLAVLCDGLGQDDDDELDALNCHHLLVRAGWSVSRLPQRSWTADWYACYEHIGKQLGN
jgi:hypothetical protein